jgi:predicted lipase
MNKKEVYLGAVLARAAYINRCDDKDFCITAHFDNKGTDTQGLFGVAYNNTFVVAFRGSEETGLNDWITDVKFMQTTIPYGKNPGNNVLVHQGFIQAYLSVRDAVLNGVNDTPHKRVICLGHSLGGAIATLCALDIEQNTTGKTVQCYTYGSPKVGNAHFAAVYNKHVPHTYRIVNGVDVIPKLPVGAYEHVGQLYHFGGEDQDDGWLGEVMEDLIGTVEDHLPHNYINVLRDQL